MEKKISQLTNRKIVIDHSPGETRVATLIEGRLAQMFVERASRPWVRGAIVNAKVTAVRKELGAVFLDLGNAQGYMDGPSKYTPIEGQSVLVEVISEPRKGKAARVSQNITLRGNFADIYPTETGYSISRKIKRKTKRSAIREFLISNVPSSVGVHIKSTDNSSDFTLIKKEIDELILKWRRLEQMTASNGSPKVLIPSPGPIGFAVKKYIDQEIHEGKNGTLFDDFAIDFQIDKALERKVSIEGGAEIIFDELEALVSVDIDIARFKTAKTQPLRLAECLAEEIFWQIRLRDLAGLILVDFPRLKDIKIRENFVRLLKKLSKENDVSLVVHGWTRTGLLEVTRPRIGLTLHEIFCGNEIGGLEAMETLGLKVLRLLIKETPGMALPQVVCSPQLRTMIQATLGESLKEVSKKLGKTVTFVDDPNSGHELFHIRNALEA